MPPERRTQRIVRVRTGCLTCRRRKKKCDEARPICGGCVRNDLSCSWPTVIPGRRDSAPENESSGLSVAERRESPSETVDELEPAQFSSSPRRNYSISSIGRDSVIVGDPPDIATADETIDRRLSVAENDHPDLMATMAVENVVPRSLSLLPGYDPESYSLLSFYLSTTAHCMDNGSTPVNPFLVQIVPLAFTSDLLLQLVIAQSAAHRAFRRREDSDAVAHSHYTKAIQLFRHGVTDFIDGRESNPLMLLVGALLMCFTEVSHSCSSQQCELLTRSEDRERGHDWYHLRSPIGCEFPLG